MIYFDDKTTIIRSMEKNDIDIIYNQYLDYDWKPIRETYEFYLREQDEKKRLVFIAEYMGDVTGIVTLVLYPTEGHLGNQGIPEIVDLCVFYRFQRHGIGSILLDVAEKEAAKRSNKIYLAVGLHSGYGAAQKLYAQRGYVPDGSGAWYKGAPLKPYSDCKLDDDLVIFLSKEL